MLLQQLRVHGDALAELAVRLDPDTEVPTRPGWTVRTLVTHLAGVTDLAAACCRTPPPAEQPVPRPHRRPGRTSSPGRTSGVRA